MAVVFRVATVLVLEQNVNHHHLRSALVDRFNRPRQFIPACHQRLAPFLVGLMVYFHKVDLDPIRYPVMPLLPQLFHRLGGIACFPGNDEVEGLVDRSFAPVCMFKEMTDDGDENTDKDIDKKMDLPPVGEMR